MGRKGLVARAVSIGVSVVFLWTNCVWAGGMFTNKLAAESSLKDVILGAQLMYTGDVALEKLLINDIEDNKGLYRNIARLRDDFRKVKGISDEDKEKVLWLVFADENNPEDKAYYIFTADGIYFRYATKPGVEDLFLEVVKGCGELTGESERIQINGDEFYREAYSINEQNIDFVNTALKSLYGEILQIEHLPLEFDSINPPNNEEIKELWNIYFNKNIDLEGKQIRFEAKAVLMMPYLVDRFFENSGDDGIKKVLGLLYIFSYLRALSIDERSDVLTDLRKEFGLADFVSFVCNNYDGVLDAQIEAINRYLNLSLNKDDVRGIVQLRDSVVSRARGIRIAYESLIQQGEGFNDIKEIIDFINSQEGIKKVIFGIEKEQEVDIPEGRLEGLKKLLWGLRQVEGVFVEIQKKESEGSAYILRNKYFVQTKERVQADIHNLLLNEIPKRILSSFLGYNAFVRWDGEALIYRAGELCRRVYELERNSVDTTFIATMNRPTALKNQLEAELENYRIFNRNIPIVVIDDSDEDILEENSDVLDSLMQRYGVFIYHITGDMKEKDIEEYARMLKKKGDQREIGELVKYLKGNIFNDISGVRNYTFLLGKGMTIMNIDDDAPPETYVVKWDKVVGEQTGKAILEAQYVDKKIKLTHQRYQSLMEPFPTDNLVTISDFRYIEPRVEKKDNYKGEKKEYLTLPVNTLVSARLIGMKGNETGLPIMGWDLRGTVGVKAESKEGIGNREVVYIAFPFVFDQDTSALAQFVRYLGRDISKDFRAVNLQHTHRMALIGTGIGGFVGDTYVIFNRAILENKNSAPSIGRDLRLEEPPFIKWVKGPALNNRVTVAYAPVAGGQQREISERMYVISNQDYTEVVGGIARKYYEEAVNSGTGSLEKLGMAYRKVADSLKELTKDDKKDLLKERELRARLLAKLGVMISKKQEEFNQSTEPKRRKELFQAINDMTLIMVQYADDFFLYHARDTKWDDYCSKDPERDYFYRVWKDGDNLLWQKVIPNLRVEERNGIKACYDYRWDESGEIISVPFGNLKKDKFYFVEPKRAIFIDKEFLKQLESGSQIVLPALVEEEDFKSEYINAVLTKIANQIGADGDAMILWGELVEASSPWDEKPATDWSMLEHQLKKVMHKIDGDELLNWLKDKNRQTGVDYKDLFSRAPFGLQDERQWVVVDAGRAIVKNDVAAFNTDKEGEVIKSLIKVQKLVEGKEDVFLLLCLLADIGRGKLPDMPHTVVSRRMAELMLRDGVLKLDDNDKKLLLWLIENHDLLLNVLNTGERLPSELGERLDEIKDQNQRNIALGLLKAYSIVELRGTELLIERRLNKIINWQVGQGGRDRLEIWRKEGVPNELMPYINKIKVFTNFLYIAQGIYKTAFLKLFRLIECYMNRNGIDLEKDNVQVHFTYLAKGDTDAIEKLEGFLKKIPENVFEDFGVLAKEVGRYVDFCQREGRWIFTFDNRLLIEEKKVEQKKEDKTPGTESEKEGGKKAVIIGGGHGTNFLAHTFKRLGISVTRAITPFDDGGSSGRLKELAKENRLGDIVAVGDFTNTLVESAGIEIQRVMEKRIGEIMENGQVSNLTEVVQKCILDIQRDRELENRTKAPAFTKFVEEGLLKAARYYDANVNGSEDKKYNKEHSIKNLVFFAYLHKAEGDIEKAIEDFISLIGVNKEDVYADFTSLDVEGVTLTANRVLGQSLITENKYGIKFTELGYGREKVPVANESILEKIRQLQKGDLLIVGPGSFFTSILANLLPEVVSEIKEARKRGVATVFVFNPAYDWEILAYYGEDIYVKLVKLIESHTGSSFGDIFNYVVINNPEWIGNIVHRMDNRREIENRGKQWLGAIGMENKDKQIEGLKNYLLEIQKNEDAKDRTRVVEAGLMSDDEEVLSYHPIKMAGVFRAIQEDIRYPYKDGIIILSDPHASVDAVYRFAYSAPKGGEYGVYVVGDILDRGKELWELLGIIDDFVLGDHDLWVMGMAMGHKALVPMWLWMQYRYEREGIAKEDFGLDLKELEEYAKLYYPGETKKLSGMMKDGMKNPGEMFCFNLYIKTLLEYAKDGKMNDEQKKWLVGLFISEIGKFLVRKDEEDKLYHLAQANKTKIIEEQMNLPEPQLNFQRASIIDDLWKHYGYTEKEEEILKDLRHQIFKLEGPGKKKTPMSLLRFLFTGKIFDIITAHPQVQRPEEIREIMFTIPGAYGKIFTLHALPPMNEEGAFVDMDENVLDDNEIVSYYTGLNEKLEFLRREFEGFFTEVNTIDDIKELNGRIDRFWKEELPEKWKEVSDEVINWYDWFVKLGDGLYSPAYARKQTRIERAYVKEGSEPDNYAYDFMTRCVENIFRIEESYIKGEINEKEFEGAVKKEWNEGSIVLSEEVKNKLMKYGLEDKDFQITPEQRKLLQGVLSATGINAQYFITERVNQKITEWFLQKFGADVMVVGHKDAKESPLIKKLAGGKIYKIDPGFTEKGGKGKAGEVVAKEQGAALLFGEGGKVFGEFELIFLRDIVEGIDEVKKRVGFAIDKDEIGRIRREVLRTIGIKDVRQYELEIPMRDIVLADELRTQLGMIVFNQDRNQIETQNPDRLLVKLRDEFKRLGISSNVINEELLEVLRGKVGKNNFYAELYYYERAKRRILPVRVGNRLVNIYRELDIPGTGAKEEAKRRIMQIPDSRNVYKPFEEPPTPTVSVPGLDLEKMGRSALSKINTITIGGETLTGDRLKEVKKFELTEHENAVIKALEDLIKGNIDNFIEPLAEDNKITKETFWKYRKRFEEKDVIILRLAAVLHDIGKGRVGINVPHPEISYAIAEEIMKNLNIDGLTEKDKKIIPWLIRYHDVYGNIYTGERSAGVLLEIMKELPQEEGGRGLQLLQIITLCDLRGTRDGAVLIERKVRFYLELDGKQEINEHDDNLFNWRVERWTGYLDGRDNQIGKKTPEKMAYTKFWQVGIKDGKIVEEAKITEEVSPEKMNILQGALDRLAKIYGHGILAVVDRIRVGDNITAGALSEKGYDVIPYAMIVREGEETVLLLDKDAFEDTKVLYLILAHDLRYSIVQLLPGIEPELEELFTNYMTLMDGLRMIENGELNLQRLQEILSKLGADEQFLLALQVLVENRVRSTEEERILAVAIEHMRAMPYYGNLFKEFSFAGDWEVRIKDAENRYQSALRVFNDIAEAKEMASKVKETKERVDRKIKGLSDVIMKARMIISSKPVWEIDLVKGLVENNKFIMLDRNELEKPENAYIKDWIERITKGLERSPFIYSDEGVPEGVRPEDVIDLREPENVNDQLPKDRLYLPLPYSISSVYLASQVVLVDGKVSEIKDKLALNTIRALYETLLGRDVADSELEQLFRMPWTVLPEIARITGTLNALRKAIQQIEKAA